MSTYNAITFCLLGLVTGVHFLFGFANVLGLKNVIFILVVRAYVWCYKEGIVSKVYGLPILFAFWCMANLGPSLYKCVLQKTHLELLGDHNLLQPLIFPSRTTHTRLFPRKHSFSYSYLLVGVPVGWRGSAGSMISADGKNDGYASVSKSWFHVDAANYLHRGKSEDGLDGKLAMYLESQVRRFFEK